MKNLKERKNYIYIELQENTKPGNEEELLSYIGDIYLDKKTSTGYVVEVKHFDRNKYDNLEELIEGLNSSEEFPAKAMSYQKYFTDNQNN